MHTAVAVAACATCLKVDAAAAAALSKLKLNLHLSSMCLPCTLPAARTIDSTTGPSRGKWAMAATILSYLHVAVELPGAACACIDLHLDTHQWSALAWNETSSCIPTPSCLRPAKVTRPWRKMSLIDPNTKYCMVLKVCKGYSKSFSAVLLLFQRILGFLRKSYLTAWSS